ncbi:MAG: zinc-dependent metalloprotease [Candidatus Bathyarchaeota archaeon]|nr:zinc-dependent metalloprotease [Candidatus Termiticorpusculum sp.]
MNVFKKKLILSMTVCAVLVLLGTGIMQPIQTAIAENPLQNNNENCLDEYCTEEHTHNDNHFGCNAYGEGRSCPPPPPLPGAENFTLEDIARFAHIPEYVTPKQPSPQEEENEGRQSSRAKANVKVMVVIDEEARDFWSKLNPMNMPASNLYNWATLVLADGSANLDDNYDITFNMHAYNDTWNSPNHLTKYSSLLSALLNENFVKNSGCDIVILLTNQLESGGNPGVGYGWDYDGKGDGHGSGAVIRVGYAIQYGPIINLVQHELSHLFGCNDQAHNPSSSSCCIMCFSCKGHATHYCSTCDTNLWINRVRYDVKGYALSATSEFIRYGSVVDSKSITGALVDKKYVYLHSGYWYSPLYYDYAVIYANMHNINNPGTSLSGTIKMYGYTATTGTHLIVKVSNDKINWTTIADTNYCTHPQNQSGADDLVLGYVSNFKYITIVVVNDWNAVGDVYFDAIRVF